LKSLGISHLYNAAHLAEYETTQMGVAGISFAELWRMAAEKGVTENPKA